MKRKAEFSEDSEGLGATALGVENGPPIIAPTKGVNDEWATLVSEFVPTRLELAVLARHYLDERCGIIHFFEWTRQSGSSEWRTLAFADRRLDRIFDLLGEEAFEQETAKTIEKWEKEFDELEKEIREGRVFNAPSSADTDESAESKPDGQSGTSEHRT